MLETFIYYIVVIQFLRFYRILRHHNLVTYRIQ